MDQVTRACSRCHKPRTTDDTAHQWYCQQCWRDYQSERRRLAESPIPTRVCEWCDKEYQPPTRRPSKFCSGACRQRATYHRANPRVARTCPSCGADVTRRRLDVIWCSPACRERERRRNTPRKERRDYDMRVKYGITHEDYDRMLAEQGGACAICNRLEADSRFGVLVVDHDHKSGNVRALLCNDCNLAIGKLQDDPAIIRAAVTYLERFPNV